jgi:signal transduction histidine kinase
VIERVRAAPALAVDVLLAVAAFVTMLVSAALTASLPHERELTAWAVPLLFAQCAPLVFRRRWPYGVTVAAGIAAAAYGIAPLPDPVAPLGVLIGYGTYVAQRPRAQSAAMTVVGLVLAVAFTWYAGDSDALDYFAAFAFIAFAALLGELARTRRAYLEQLEARAEQLERERDTKAAAAVALERARIARELHDVVAHHVSMMVVQAEAAGSAADDPAPFDAIATTGREALTELRHMVGLLRSEHEPSPIEPQPGIADLGRHADQVSSAGLPVALHIDGEPRPVAAAVDLSAYRIVQEALTNTLKHAGTARADVDVRWRPDAIELVIADDGTGGTGTSDRTGDRAADGRPGGHGLVGIGERVALFGGTFRAGPRDGGGFAVEAHLPC